MLFKKETIRLRVLAVILYVVFMIFVITSVGSPFLPGDFDPVPPDPPVNECSDQPVIMKSRTDYSGTTLYWVDNDCDFSCDYVTLFRAVNLAGARVDVLIRAMSCDEGDKMWETFLLIINKDLLYGKTL